MVVDRLRQRIAEACKMRAAFRRVDVVDESIDIFRESIRMLHGDLNEDALALALAVNDIGIQGNIGLIEVRDKLPDTSFIIEGFVVLHLPVVDQVDLESLCKESGLSQTGLDRLIIKYRRFKNFRVRLECDLRAVFVFRTASDDLDGMHDLAALIALHVNTSVFINTHFQPFGKRVDYGSADAVQAAGNFITAVAELSSRMQDRKYDFQRGFARFLLDIHRDAAAVVDDGDGIIRIDRDRDLLTKTCQRLVNTVINDLIDHVMQAARSRGADVHARTLTDGFKAFQDLDLGSIVVVLIVTVIHFEALLDLFKIFIIFHFSLRSHALSLAVT